jgi:acetoin utilization deacetylase AcuC-like enzyme
VNQERAVQKPGRVAPASAGQVRRLQPAITPLRVLLLLCAAAPLALAAVGLVDDDAFLEHRTGAAHPERPERLSAIREALAPIADRLLRLPVREATREDLLLVHTVEYVHLVEREVAEGRDRLSTGDTALSAGSLHAARLAAGGVLAACDAVMDGRVRRAFCAVRPPGHHAMPDAGMGFCIFANVAIAARHLMERRGLERVLVVDLDVHHGNGTYAALKAEPRAFQFHLHQLGIYPGSGVGPGAGRSDESGEGPAQGHTINLPLPAGAGDEAFLAALDQRLAPAMERWQPQFILVSAGYDAHQDDPLGGLAVTTDGYRRCFARLARLADQHGDGRLVAVLEGGYHLPALGAAVRATLEALER